MSGLGSSRLCSLLCRAELAPLLYYSRCKVAERDPLCVSMAQGSGASSALQGSRRKAAEQAPLCKAHGARQRSKLRSTRLTEQGSGASSALQGSRRKAAEQAPLYKAHGARRRSKLRSTRLTAQDGGASSALQGSRHKMAEQALLYGARGLRQRSQLRSTKPRGDVKKRRPKAALSRLSRCKRGSVFTAAGRSRSFACRRSSPGPVPWPGCRSRRLG